MVRNMLIALAVVYSLAVATALHAADIPLPATNPATQSSIDSARLMALEIAARAQGGGYSNGRFTPAVPRPAPVSSPAPAQAAAPSPACGDVKGLAADTTDYNGMRFMPLRRNGVSREFKLPSRGEAMNRAQALQAAIAGGKGESELAQAALQTDAATDPRVQAQTELANITGNAPPPADPNALAKQAVLREIQKYRAAGGKF